MATLSQTVAKLGRLVEAEVTLPTATGTVNSVTIPANSVVLSAGAVVTEAVAGSSAHTFNLDLGGTDIATALNVQAASLGGILGYFIGSYFFDLGMIVVEFYNYEEKVINLKNSLSEGSGLYVWLATLFLAGFTPLPFKVFTITSGMIGFNLPIFFIICLFSRGLRFFIVSYLSYKFGDIFSKFMKTDAAKWFTILGIIIVLIFTLIYFAIK